MTITSSHSSKGAVFTALALFLGALAVYYPALPGEFVFDDLWQIVNNPRFERASDWQDVFRWTIDPGNLYRPLVSLSLLLNYWCSGTEPWSYHLVNIFLHGACTALLFLLLLHYFSFALSFLSALLFLIHPVHTEVIAVVYNRTESMNVLFGLAACLSALRFDQEKRIKSICWGMVCLFFLSASLLCKESGIIFFALAPLCLFIQGKRRDSAFIKKSFYSLAAISVLLAGYFLLRRSVLGSFLGEKFTPGPVDNPLGSLPPIERFFNSLSLLFDYFKLSIFPVPLSADYSFAKIKPVEDWFFTIASVKSLFALGIAALTIILTAKRRPASFCFLAFFLPLLISGNLIVLNNVAFAERFAYLPSLLGCFLISGSVLYFKRTSYRFALAGTVVLFFCSLLWIRIPLWHDNASLLSFEILQSPESASVQEAYGRALYSRGKYKKALVHANKALEIYPDFILARLLRAQIYGAQGKLEEAKKELNSILVREPENTDALSGLGWIELTRGNEPAARKFFHRALRAKTRNESVLIGLFACSVLENDYTTATRWKALLSRRAEKDPRFVKYLQLMKPLSDY